MLKLSVKEHWNHDVVIADILKNFGLQAFSGETSAIEAAVNMHLRLLATY